MYLPPTRIMPMLTDFPRTITPSTVISSSKPVDDGKGASQNASTTVPLLSTTLQPLVQPIDNWVKTGTQYYENLVQQEEKVAQQIPVYQAWQETIQKLTPPQTHLNAFHKPLIEAKEKQHHPWDFLNNIMGVQATLWPIILAGWSVFEHQQTGNKNIKLATEAVKASDENAHVFANHMSETAFNRFKGVENILAPIATGLTIYNAVQFGREAYKRSHTQTQNKPYATLQGTASGIGDFLYNFITGVLAPVVLITSIIQNPMIHSMQWIDQHLVQGLLKRPKPLLSNPKFMMGYAITITGFSSLMIPILSRYIDPAISQFVNDVVYRFSNKLLKLAFPKAYEKQKEALATEELTQTNLKPEKQHSKEITSNTKQKQPHI